mgnify:CR=1 FL=1
MELLVCVKQVPDTSEIKLDPETNNLIRTGLPSIVNPDDMHALEAALTVKDQYEGSRVTVLSMGPPQAEEALRQCLSLGADDAVLVTDRAFGGADTLATSYTIASAIRHIQRTMNRQFQIIFCGKQAIDGDTAQVGPQIAEELGMAQATYACKFAVDTAAQKATVTREHENGYEIVEVPLPVLVTATAELNEPRQPGLWSSIYAKRYEISHITLRDMPNIDESRIGLNGSPTRVRKVYQPPLRGKVEMLPNVEEGSKKVLELAYNIKPEKFAHLLVPSDAPVAAEEPNDDGVDVKDPANTDDEFIFYEPIIKNDAINDTSINYIGYAFASGKSNITKTGIVYTATFKILDEAAIGTTQLNIAGRNGQDTADVSNIDEKAVPIVVSYTHLTLPTNSLV